MSNNLCKYIHGLRSFHDHNQQHMSALLGIAQSTYSKKERGITPFSIDDLRVIAKEFKMDIHELLKQGEIDNNATTRIKYSL